MGAEGRVGPGPAEATGSPAPTTPGCRCGHVLGTIVETAHGWRPHDPGGPCGHHCHADLASYAGGAGRPARRAHAMAPLGPVLRPGPSHLPASHCRASWRRAVAGSSSHGHRQPPVPALKLEGVLERCVGARVPASGTYAAASGCATMPDGRPLCEQPVVATHHGAVLQRAPRAEAEPPVVGETTQARRWCCLESLLLGGCVVRHRQPQLARWRVCTAACCRRGTPASHDEASPARRPTQGQRSPR